MSKQYRAVVVDWEPMMEHIKLSDLLKKEAVGPLTRTTEKEPGRTVDPAKFAAQAEKFLKALQTASDKYYAKEYPTLNKPKFSFDKGNKYWRIVKDFGQRSAYGFLDSRNGDILKTASWKAPAKGVRGNIFDADMGYNSTTPYGVRYFK